MRKYTTIISNHQIKFAPPIIGGVNGYAQSYGDGHRHRADKHRPSVQRPVLVDVMQVLYFMQILYFMPVFYFI